jgi:hypothetical protein
MNPINRNTQFISNPKTIFLIDSFGALLTAILLYFIVRTFNEFFGLPREVTECLSCIALIFFIYSGSCYFFATQNLKLFLKIVCTANILYCALTFGIILYFYKSMTAFGIIYFSVEIVVIIGLVFLEVRAIRKHH